MDYLSFMFVLDILGIKLSFTFMHLADTCMTYVAFKVNILWVLALPGNRTHDFGVASAML